MAQGLRSGSPAIVCQVLHPRDLSSSDIDVWRELQAAQPAFESALLSPQFAQLVGELRSDSRVAIWRDGATPVGFLAYHHRRGDVGRPIGAPFCDYSALISVANFPLTAAEAIRMAGLSSLRFQGLRDPYGLFDQAGAFDRSEAYLIRPGADPAAYQQARQAHNPKRYRNLRRLKNKLEREVGPISLVPSHGDASAFETLLSWKRDQALASGLHDFVGGGWTDGFLRRVFAAQDGALQGGLYLLKAGDRLVAAHFGVTLNGRFHSWVSSYDPAVYAYGPGVVFLLSVLENWSGLGLELYDLGVGTGFYKADFCAEIVPVVSGVLYADDARGAAQRRRSAWVENAAQVLGERPAALAARLRRRLDVIAAIELTLPGRLRGVAYALSVMNKRSRPAESASE